MRNENVSSNSELFTEHYFSITTLADTESNAEDPQDITYNFKNKDRKYIREFLKINFI